VASGKNIQAENTKDESGEYSGSIWISKAMFGTLELKFSGNTFLIEGDIGFDSEGTYKKDGENIVFTYSDGRKETAKVTGNIINLSGTVFVKQ
jgi:hypothetical protein